jgi:hypothetical protein
VKVCENMVLRVIFAPSRNEDTGYCRNLYKEKLSRICSSPGVIRMIKSRRMRMRSIYHA